jgi:hypothetical protein
MQSNYRPTATIREHLERDVRAIHEALADPILAEPNTEDLELVRLPSGEFAWLRPDRARP